MGSGKKQRLDKDISMREYTDHIVELDHTISKAILNHILKGSYNPAMIVGMLENIKQRLVMLPKIALEGGPELEKLLPTSYIG